MRFDSLHLFSNTEKLNTVKTKVKTEKHKEKLVGGNKNQSKDLKFSEFNI